MSFKSEKKGEVHIIMCPEEIEATAVKLLESQTKTWASIDCPLHVFDFRDTKIIHNHFYRPAVLFSQGLRAHHKHLASLNINPTLLKQFETDGLLSVLNPAKTLQEAAAKAGIKAPASGTGINADFVSPFITAAQMVLKVQANTPSTPGKPFLKKQGFPYEIAIAGVINLVSDQFNGSITLCFPENVFLKIYSNMLGEEAPSINEEVESAAGELLNIIFGQVKAMLNNKKGFTIRSAIPTVLSGQKLRVSSVVQGTTIVLPFTTDYGGFHIEITAEMTSVTS